MSRFVPRFAAVLLALALSLPTGRAHAWGRTGHQIATAIAESRMTTTTLERVRAILDPAEDFIPCSLWADMVRPMRPESAPWHYVNFHIAAEKYNAADCPNGDCVTERIVIFRDELVHWQEMEPVERAEALKFLVHFVEDQTQPLHNANENDRGGNDKKVSWNGWTGNLHSVWDGGFIYRYTEETGMTNDQLLQELNGEIRPEAVMLWTQGEPLDWTIESHNIAVEFVYPGWSPELTNLYYLKGLGVSRVQLQKAGIRVAHLLNTLFDPDYDGKLPVLREVRFPEGPPPRD